MSAIGTILSSGPRALWALAVALLVGAQPAAAASAAIDVKVADDGSVSIVATALIAADERTAWRVLTDYERYPDFIPGVRRSHVVTRDGSTLTVKQSVDAPVWALGNPMDVTYEITESKPGQLHSRGMARGTLLDSVYKLTTVDDGVRLEYTGRLAVPPGWLAPLERSTGQRLLEREFQALADEIELRGRGESR